MEGARRSRFSCHWPGKGEDSWNLEPWVPKRASYIFPIRLLDVAIDMVEEQVNQKA